MNPPIAREQLAAMRCANAPAGGRLDPTVLKPQLAELPGWILHDDTLLRSYAFDDYDGTLGFVNALAEIARREDHHPELRMGYDRCEVRWTTHSVGGVSLNDFICAALTEAVASGTGGRPITARQQ